MIISKLCFHSCHKVRLCYLKILFTFNDKTIVSTEFANLRQDCASKNMFVRYFIIIIFNYEQKLLLSGLLDFTIDWRQVRGII